MDHMRDVLEIRGGGGGGVFMFLKLYFRSSKMSKCKNYLFSFVIIGLTATSAIQHFKMDLVQCCNI